MSETKVHHKRNRDDDEVVDNNGSDVDSEPGVTRVTPRKRRKPSSPTADVVPLSFRQLCVKYQIPYPHLSSREGEHIEGCLQCQDLWPLYLYEHHYRLKEKMEKVLEGFQDLTEQDRLMHLKVLKRRDDQWRKQLIHSRPLNGYQLFLRQQRVDSDVTHKLPFGETTRILAQVWRKFSSEEKQKYMDQAEELRLKQEEEESQEPVFRQRMAKAIKRHHRQSGRKDPTKLRKPMNAYMIFLQDRWQQARRVDNTCRYRDVMTEASVAWKRMSEHDRLPYMTRAIQIKRVYEENKAAVMVNRAPQVEQSPPQ
jgi:hypothetical protein